MSSKGGGYRTSPIVPVVLTGIDSASAAVVKASIR